MNDNCQPKWETLYLNDSTEDLNIKILMLNFFPPPIRDVDRSEHISLRNSKSTVERVAVRPVNSTYLN